MGEEEEDELEEGEVRGEGEEGEANHCDSMNSSAEDSGNNIIIHSFLSEDMARLIP